MTFHDTYDGQTHFDPAAERKARLEAIREVVVKAVPEIMELKFGCDVVVALRGKENIGHRLGTKITSLMSHGAWMTLSFGEYEEHEMTILGLPVTLEDVLRAMHIGEFATRESAEIEGMYIQTLCLMWNLGQPLDSQSDETIAFLNKILCTEV